MKYITLFLVIISIEMYSQTTPGEYTVKNVITNTKNSDFGTSFFGKDKVIFAAPKDNTVLTKKTWSGNNQAFLDLYIGTINEKGEIIGKKRVLGDVNGKFHEGVVSFTKDLKTVYFSANNYTDKNKAKKDSTGIVNIQLYKASVGDNGEWTNIIKLPFNSDEYSTGHPTLNIDDTKLYFISDRPESVGKTDIYVIDVNADGTYGEPKNLGTKINTEEREMFPFISDDNILYFSSNGHPGYGALDVFASRIFDTTVSEPINLEDPVNSSNDDFAFIINDDKHKGYFSSNNRKDGKGDDDIYSFIAFPPLQIEGSQTISGIVIDKETQKLIPEAIVVLQDEEGNELERVKVSANTDSNLVPSLSDLNKNNQEKITAVSGEVADIHVEKTVDNLNPNAGEEVEFTVEVTNKGTEEATEIKVSDILPEGFEYIHDDGSGIYRSDTDVLTLPKLAPGEKTILKIKAITPKNVNDLDVNNQESISTTTGDVADVHVKKTVDNPTPNAGEEVEFTVEVTNKGTGEATEIKVSDILPEGYEYVHDDGSGIYQPDTDILTLPKLAPGEKTTLKIKAIKPKEDLNKNNLNKVTVVNGVAADVHIFKTVDNPTPKAGEEVEFTVEVTNKGTGEATEIKVSDILPEGYEHVHDDGLGTYQSTTDILTLPNLAAGEKITLKIKAITITDNLNHKNRDKVSAITGDVNDIRINKRVDKLNPKTGDEVEFTIEITNNGSRKAKGIKVSDILPEGYTYVSDDGSGVYISDADIITLPNLAKGETQTIKIKAILLPSGNDGSFSFEAKSDTKYKIVVIAPGYLKEETAIKTVNDTDVDPLEMNVSLAQELRVVDEKIMININTIYFDFDKWNIRPEAAKELNKVVDVMKEHPSMVIEGGSHTDSRAREAYNQKLSEKRAKSTVDYIVARGIDPSRITSKGYGEMQLVNNCSSFVKCSREEHQLNRRTEFVIVNDNDRFTSNAATLENVKIDRKANLTFVEVESNTVENKTSETDDTSSDEINSKQSTISESKSIRIPPIYFDFDKWGISDSELKQLDNVVQIMKDNPTIIVEAGSHTDSKNLESYNQLLSEKRAKSVVKYIVSKGISPDRIIGKGYGEMRLTNHCKSFVKCTPEEQQANRRTEFKIIKF